MKHLIKYLWVFLCLLFCTTNTSAQVFCPGDIIFSQNFTTMTMRFPSDLQQVSESFINTDIFEGRELVMHRDGVYMIQDIPLHNATQLSVSFTQVTGIYYGSMFYTFDGSTSYVGWPNAEDLWKNSKVNVTIPCEGKKTISLKIKKLTTYSDPNYYIDNFLVKANKVSYTYTRAVNEGALGTLCLPMAVNSLSECGADFYEIAGKRMKGDEATSIVFREVDVLEAGKPYIFLANSEQLSLTMSGKGAADPQSSNGLYGTFDRYAFAEDKAFAEGEYYIVNTRNQIQVASNRSGVVANRAFVKLSEVPVYDESNLSSGSRLLVLDSDGFSAEEVQSTGIENPRSHLTEISSAVYDLQGQRITIPSGLCIRAGKLEYFRP